MATKICWKFFYRALQLPTFFPKLIYDEYNLRGGIVQEAENLQEKKAVIMGCIFMPLWRVFLWSYVVLFRYIR